MYITFKKVIRHGNIQESIFDLSIDSFNNLQPDETKIITAEKDDLTSYFVSHSNMNMYQIPKTELDKDKIRSMYSTFYIPKKSGGMRRIDAPNDDLKKYLSDVKDYLEKGLRILPNDAAHAYVQGRSTITSIKVHQANESKWFLKLDMKNFFPSHNKEYLYKMLSQVYPISMLVKDQEYKDNLNNMLDYALLNGELPQGTPLSPTLTNICMVPIDYQIKGKLNHLPDHLVYTRYADDILISSQYKFDYKKVIKEIQKILEENGCPFYINEEKTRFGSSAGSNWNLGVMLNKDNRMTVGHKQNQRFRAALFSLLKDHEHGIRWPYEDRMVLGGQISYYMMVDPEYTQATIKRYEDRFAANINYIIYKEDNETR